MYDMLKTIFLDILGIKPVPISYGGPHKYIDCVAPNTTPTGYPVYDSTGFVAVGEDRSGIL
jgi:hypothetical protein